VLFRFRPVLGSRKAVNVYSPLRPAVPLLFDWIVEHRSSNWKKPVKTKAKKAAILLCGWGFLLLGAVGLFLPLFKGVLLLFVGLLILSSEYVWAHNLLDKIRIRFPGLSSRLDRVTSMAHKWIRKLFHNAPPGISRGTTKT
jgi:hypothetical protein